MRLYGPWRQMDLKFDGKENFVTKSRKPTAAERAQKVALFRFQVISPALERELSKAQRGEIVRELIQETYDHPITGPRKYSRESVDRWIRAYHEGGFEALVPAVTRPAPRTDSEVLDLAAGLKTENPNRTAAQVRRILLSSTGWSPSESTLLRLFHARDLMGPTSGEAGEVFGRFEAAHANQRWVGDALHGPKLFGKRTYLFAFLDDHSRLLTGYRFAFAEDTLRMSWALKNGLTSRGVPESIYVDNGAPYVDAWLLRACGKLRIRLIHSTPNRPQGKGKIERFFRTVRDQFLVELTGQEVAKIEESAPDHAAGLAEMNRLFSAWVETVYHHNIHSETKQKPLDRWDAFWAKAGHRPPLPAGDDLAEAFRWSEHRTVRKTATVSLHSNTYEVDPALVGRRVELVFSPFAMNAIEVRYQDKSFGAAIPHVIRRHTHPKAKPETPPAPAPRTGIDYLRLVGEDHHAQFRTDQRINYHALTQGTGDEHTAGPTREEDTAGKASNDAQEDSEEVQGQMSIDDFIHDTNDEQDIS